MSPRTPWAWPSSTKSRAMRPIGVGLRDWLPVAAYQAWRWAGPSRDAPRTGVPTGTGLACAAAGAGRAAARAAAAVRRPGAARRRVRTRRLLPAPRPGVHRAGRGERLLARL